MRNQTNKKTKEKFSEESTIEDIMKSKEGIRVLIKYNVPCLGCPLSSFEISKLKLGEVARAYGIDAKSLLKELNKKNVSK